VSNPIKKSLDATADAYWSGAAAFFFDNKYVVDIPQASGAETVCYALDFPHTRLGEDGWGGAWVKLEELFAFTGFFVGPGGGANPSGTEKVIALTAPGYQFPAGTAYNGVMELFTSDALSLTCSFTTPTFQTQSPRDEMRAQSVRVEGQITASAGQPLPTVVVSNGDGSVSHSKTFDVTAGVLYTGSLLRERNRKLKPSLHDNYLKARVSGKFDTGSEFYGLDLAVSSVGRRGR
jgi:hypothetical protein